MILPDRFDDLLDYETSEHIIDIIRGWIEHPHEKYNDVHVTNINEWIIDPLRQYRENAYKKGHWVEAHQGWGKLSQETGEYDDNGPWIPRQWHWETNASEAALKLLLAAEEIVYRYEYVYPEPNGDFIFWSEMTLLHLDSMVEHWKEFQRLMNSFRATKAEEEVSQITIEVEQAKIAERNAVEKASKANEGRIKGGITTGRLSQEAAEPEHEKIRCFACEICGEAGPRGKSIGFIIQELKKKKYGVTLGRRQLYNILGPDFAPPTQEP